MPVHQVGKAETKKGLTLMHTDATWTEPVVDKYMGARQKKCNSTTTNIHVILCRAPIWITLELELQSLGSVSW